MIPLFPPALITASGQCLDGSNRMATRMDVDSWGQGRAAGRESPWGLDIMLSFKEWIPLPLLKFFSGLIGESTIKWLLWGPITSPTHLFIGPFYSRKSCFLPGSWPMLCTSSWTCCILDLTWFHFSSMVQLQKNPPISPRVQTSCSISAKSQLLWNCMRHDQRASFQSRNQIPAVHYPEREAPDLVSAYVINLALPPSGKNTTAFSKSDLHRAGWRLHSMVLGWAPSLHISYL